MSAPHHPQTLGTLERVHATLKAELHLLVYRHPEIRRAALVHVIRFDNHEPDHEGIGNLIPIDRYDGRRRAMLQRRAAQKSETLARRVRYNRAAAMQGTRTELTGDLSIPRGLTESHRC